MTYDVVVESSARKSIDDAFIPIQPFAVPL